MTMLKIALAVILAAALTSAAACGWWPGSSEPESYDDRDDRPTAERSDSRDEPTRSNFPTRMAPFGGTTTPTPAGRSAAPALPTRNNGPAAPGGSAAPRAGTGARREYAACLDQIGLLTAAGDSGMKDFIAPYRCRQMEPAPPERWNPRCVQDETEWYLERYGVDAGYDLGDIAHWYGLVACVPDYAPDDRTDNASNAYAACLDQIALLLANRQSDDAAQAVGPYRCRHLEPAPRERWNPRCVHDAEQWYVERYESGSAYDVDDIGFWYGLVTCVPAADPALSSGDSNGYRHTFAACLDEIALLMSNEWSNTASFIIAPYRCRQQEPPPPERWNPRCVHDEREWYRERYANDSYGVGELAAWYGLAVCAPGYAP